MIAPGSQIGRAGDPHFRRREGRPAVGPVQGDVLLAELLGKKHDVLVFRRENDAVPGELAKVVGRSQGRRRAVPGDRHVREIKSTVDAP